MERIYHYTVHIEPGEDGAFVVTVPVLPGCHTQGSTYSEALVMAQECIEGFLEALTRQGIPIPTEEPLHPLPVDVLMSVRSPLVA